MDALVAIAEEGSVTSAAAALGITQPAVSTRLKSLEQQVGASLFHRSRAGMDLTPAGAELLGVVRRAYAELGEATRSLQMSASQTEGVVKIGSECFTSFHWLDRVVSHFRKDYPRVELDVDLSPVGDRIDQVLDGTLDVHFTTVVKKSPHLRARELFPDEIVALVHPDHPFAAKRSLTAQDFKDQTVIVYHESKSDLVTQVLRPAHVRPTRIVQAKVTEGAMQMAESQLGIAVMASWIAEPQIKSGTLTPVRITRSGLKRHWHAVTRRRGPLYVERFVDSVVAVGRG